MDSENDLQKFRIDTSEQLGAIPRVLRELQELVPLLSVAYSTDGRTFGYEAPLSMSIPLGSYVALSTQDGREYLGQIITKEVSIRQGAEIGLELDPGLSALLPQGVNLSPSHTYPLQRRYAHGTGVILGRRNSHGCVPTTGEDGFQSTISPGRRRSGSQVSDREQRDDSRDRPRTPYGRSAPRKAEGGRFRPAHLPVRPVRFRKDFRHGRDTRAPLAGDGPQDHRPRPQLRLRPFGADALPPPR